MATSPAFTPAPDTAETPVKAPSPLTKLSRRARNLGVSATRTIAGVAERAESALETPAGDQFGATAGVVAGTTARVTNLAKHLVKSVGAQTAALVAGLGIGVAAPIAVELAPVRTAHKRDFRLVGQATRLGKAEVTIDFGGGVTKTLALDAFSNSRAAVSSDRDVPVIVTKMKDAAGAEHFIVVNTSDRQVYSLAIG